jgi:DNA polymerase I-like protein with 3'-5' exonuclease and polymerase domains
MHKLGYNFAHQCHDELVYVVRKEIAPVVKALLRTELTRRPSWAMDLPLKADVNDDPEKPSFHATSYGMAK